ncbi:hypothetical protein M9H77_31718 [Catharanthus roseus]|uniref:Uncharacterized protein n=1 Tax=Catharanthus roseus TaxID=4058 RepID=A0ACC0A1T0_CATRO|nr:hypothetical protein M9H77_31718 [Catharanthus roseus]
MQVKIQGLIFSKMGKQGNNLEKNWLVLGETTLPSTARLPLPSPVGLVLIGFPLECVVAKSSIEVLHEEKNRLDGNYLNVLIVRCGGAVLYASPSTGIHATNFSASDRDASPFCVLKTVQN